MPGTGPHCGSHLVTLSPFARRTITFRGFSSKGALELHDVARKKLVRTRNFLHPAGVRLG